MPLYCCRAVCTFTSLILLSLASAQAAQKTVWCVYQDITNSRDFFSSVFPYNDRGSGVIDPSRISDPFALFLMNHYSGLDSRGIFPSCSAYDTAGEAENAKSEFVEKASHYTAIIDTGWVP